MKLERIDFHLRVYVRVYEPIDVLFLARIRLLSIASIFRKNEAIPVLFAQWERWNMKSFVLALSLGDENFSEGVWIINTFPVKDILHFRLKGLG